MHWFFSIALGQFTYLKILNMKKISGKQIVLGIVSAAALSVMIYFLQTHLPYLRFALMILFAGIFAGLIMRTKLDLAITSYTLAIGISYGFYLVAALPIHMILWLLPIAEYDIILALFTPPLQFAFIYVLFSINRMKKGMIFLQDRGAGVVGLIISGITLIAIVVIPNQAISEEIRMALFIGAVLSVVGTIVWWRRALMKLYKQRTQQRYIQKLEESLAKYASESKNMNTVFHKDNKLWAGTYEITGLCAEIAEKLTPLLSELEALCEDKKLSAIYEDVSDCAETASRIASLQGTIEELLHDRMAMADKTQRELKVLPTTNDALFDGVMQSMLARANEREILLDFTLLSNIDELLETISPVKLSTLLADLLENAIIATSYSDYKHILVSFSFNAGSYELSVQDSGIPFEQHTLEKLGKERASTHLSEGGSGIGYMTVFEILREYDASLIITQCPMQEFEFSKTVTLRFDGKGEYNVL